MAWWQNNNTTGWLMHLRAAMICRMQNDPDQELRRSGSKARFLVHVGLPKCGSTSLQKVFATAPGITFLGKSLLHYADSRIGQFTRLVAPFADVRMSDQHGYREAFAAGLAGAGGKPVVLSDEILSSVGFAARGTGNSFLQILDNVAAVAGPFELMIVVREQRAFLKSYYKQWVLGGGHLCFQDFIAAILLRRQRFLLPMLDYPALASAAGQIASRVHVLVFERLFSDRAYREAKFAAMGISGISGHFAGVQERPSRSDAEIAGKLAEARKNPWPALLSMNKAFLGPDLYTAQTLDSPDALATANAIKSLNLTIRSRGETAAESMFTLDAAVEVDLLRHFKMFNHRLPEIDSGTDWPSLDYVL